MPHSISHNTMAGYVDYAKILYDSPLLTVNAIIVVTWTTCISCAASVGNSFSGVITTLHDMPYQKVS